MSNAVKDGKLLYFSPSSVKLASECLRKWWYKYVGGKTPPETQAQKRGKEIHARIEHYLRTGEDQLERTERAAMEFMPAPMSPGMLLEHEICPDDREIVFANIPMKGFIDLAHDPAYPETGQAEITDWKTTRDEKWFQQPRTHQMSLYAKWCFVLGFESVRTHHVYILTRGAPRAERLSAHWPSESVVDARLQELDIEHWVEMMKISACDDDPEDVPGNKDECGNYGGCPHRHYCSVGRSSVLDNLFNNEEGAMSLIDKARTAQKIDTSLIAEELWGRVRSLGKGWPGIADDLGELVGEEPGNRFGLGEFAEYRLETFEELVEFANAFGVGVPTPAPPDAPPSEPEKHAPPPPPAPVEFSIEEQAHQALATLKESKCGKKDRLAAAEVLETALEAALGDALPMPSSTDADEFRTALRKFLGLS